MVQSTYTCEEIRRLYMAAYEANKDTIDRRTAAGIEQHRKGDCLLKVLDSSGRPVPKAKVRIVQKQHDFRYGANIFMLDEFPHEEQDAQYRAMFKDHFNLATVPFYWDALEPEEGRLRFAKDSEKIYRRPAPDLCLEYCREHGISPKLHCLFYDKFTPQWTIPLSREEMEAKLEIRIRQIAQRYRGKLYEFEVVNELLCFWDEKTKLFLRKDLVNWAFDLARKYLPEETLVINEAASLAEIGGRRHRHAYYQLVENALLKGASIDKIGVQNHLFTGVAAHSDEEYDASIREGVSMNDVQACLDGLDVLAELGLPVEITEVTVPTFGDSPEHERLQADMLRLWYTAWFSHPAVHEVVYWNTVDGYAYTGNPNWVENNCRGGLFHHDLTPKESARMLKKLFDEVWHTELDRALDPDGCIAFRGFYGTYELQIDGKVYPFGLHKDQSGCVEVRIGE